MEEKLGKFDMRIQKVHGTYPLLKTSDEGHTIPSYLVIDLLGNTIYMENTFKLQKEVQHIQDGHMYRFPVYCKLYSGAANKLMEVIKPFAEMIWSGYRIHDGHGRISGDGRAYLDLINELCMDTIISQNSNFRK